MNSEIMNRMQEGGITLPVATGPGGKYKPVIVSEGLLYASGQVAKQDGELAYRGKVGGEIDVETGQAAARLAMLNILAQVEAAVGLDRITQVLKVNGYVATTEDFVKHAAVMDGASGVLGEVLGDAGAHARTSIGVATLPGNAPVEVELIARVSDAS